MKLALLVIGLGASIAPLDFAVNIAFPAITQAFGLQTQSIRWVAVCYVLTYGSLMLGFGALGDRIGHLRVFRAGLVLAALAFTLCALAPSYPWLLVARVIQGVAVALTLSCAPALATALVDEQQRTWALSAYGSLSSLAALLAPLVGGACVAIFGWPGVYAFRIPIALLALACLPRLASALQPQAKTTDAAGQRFDLAGNSLLAASVGLLLLAPAIFRPGTGAALAVLLALLGGALMWAFVRRDRTASRRFMPPALVRDTDFQLLNVTAVVVQFTSFAVPLITPYFLIRMVGWDPVSSGALLTVWALGSLLGAALTPRLIAVMGARGTAFVAELLVCAGLAGMAAWSATPGMAVMLACLLCQGAGLGLFQVAYSDLVVASLPASSRGVAGSLTMVTRTIGLVLGASIWLWIVQAYENAVLPTGGSAQGQFLLAFGRVFGTAALVSGLCLLLEALRRRVRSRPAARSSQR